MKKEDIDNVDDLLDDEAPAESYPTNDTFANDILDEEKDTGKTREDGILRYKIGEYTFNSYHEYQNGRADVKKIEAITDELDIHDPEVAVRLYNMIRDGQIVFRTKIGADFFDHVSDIVADKSVGLIEDKAAVDEAEQKVSAQRFIGMAVISAAVVLFSYFGFRELNDYLDTRRLAQLQQEAQQESATSVEAGSANDDPVSGSADDPFANKDDEQVDPSTLSILPAYKELYDQNNDLAGWLTIDGTVVDYPVMQTDDNEYYLKHDFDKKEDSSGALFVDYRSDIVNPTVNTIIYGHNMNNGSMFGSLKNYLDEDYYDQHKNVEFNTIYEKRKYEIVAVCLAQVEASSDNSFRYYNFIDASNMNEWNAFVTSISSMSVFGSDIDIEAGDEVLTLSTCNNYTEDGRLFLVAKRIK